MHILFPLWLGGIGTGEIVILLIIVLVIFGAGKLPQIGEALGKGIKNFKTAVTSKDDENENQKQLNSENKQKAPKKKEHAEKGEIK